MKLKSILVSILAAGLFYTGNNIYGKDKHKTTNEKAAGYISPVQAGIWTPVQIFDEKTGIYGFSLSLPYTQKKYCVGIDIGLFPYSDTLGGIQSGFLNMSRKVYGLQAGLINRSAKSVYGLQAGAANIAQEYGHDGDSVAMQAGSINVSHGNFLGFQTGAGNIAYDGFSGLQAGFFNSIDNKSESKDNGFAIQIGLFNFNPDALLPFCIGINIEL